MPSKNIGNIPTKSTNAKQNIDTDKAASYNKDNNVHNASEGATSRNALEADSQTAQAQDSGFFESEDWSEEKFDPTYNSWAESTSLPYIEPLDGMVQRWVRVEAEGRDDPSNIQKMIGVGKWQPRPLSTIPSKYVEALKGKNTFLGDVLIVRGMVLCQTDKANIEMRKKMFQQKADQQIVAVEQDLLKTERAGVPIQREYSSRVQVGGRKPAIARD